MKPVGVIASMPVLRMKEGMHLECVAAALLKVALVAIRYMHQVKSKFVLVYSYFPTISYIPQIHHTKSQSR